MRTEATTKSRIPSVLSIVSTLPYASLRYTALYRAIPRYSTFPPAIPRYSALLYAMLRFLALYRAALRLLALHRSTLHYTALGCTTPHYSRLSCSISTLFYSINFKLTTGRLDVKTDEGCDDPATYSELYTKGDQNLA